MSFRFAKSIAPTIEAQDSYGRAMEEQSRLLGAQMQTLLAGVLGLTYKAPSRITTGQLLFSDGVYWNPVGDNQANAIFVDNGTLRLIRTDPIGWCMPYPGKALIKGHVFAASVEIKQGKVVIIGRPQ